MLFDLLRQSAVEAGDIPLVITPSRRLTYAECAELAAAHARDLYAHSVTRAGCVIGDAAELITLLCAAAASGTELCVYPQPSDAATVSELARQLGHTVMISDAPMRLEGVQVRPIEALAGSGAGVVLPPQSAAPVLILTSGTTSRPRAARHDWGRLVAAPHRGHGQPGTRWLLTYNLSQFGGIQVLLHVLASRSTLVVPASRAAPDAAAAMQNHGVTHVSATPTFWRLLATWLQTDGTTAIELQQITLSGEAVGDALLAQLRGLFPDAHISQVYAGTEIGTVVSVADGRAGLPASVLERGEDSGMQLRIVDGELQARGRAGMLGYYGEAARPEADWQPTGDLVEVRGDRIHFVGRASETINVGGVKVHPLPVEEVIASVPGVKLVRAYGRRNPVTGEVVAVDVVPLPGVDPQALRREIRQACRDLPPAAQPRLVRLRDELEVRAQKLARSRAALEA